MKATKVAKLFQLRFLKGLEDGLGEITEEHIRRSQPSRPVPPSAKVVGTLPKKFQALLALSLLLADKRNAAAKVCWDERMRGGTPRYDVLRTWTDVAGTIDDLFWTCVRVEMPPPEELAYEEGIEVRLGPNFEVYYYAMQREEETNEALSLELKGLEQSGHRVLH